MSAMRQKIGDGKQTQAFARPLQSRKPLPQVSQSPMGQHRRQKS